VVQCAEAHGVLGGHVRTCRRAQQQDQKENRYNTAERSDLPSHLLTGQSAPVTLYRLRRDGEFASANGKGEQAECARWPQQRDKPKGHEQDEPRHRHGPQPQVLAERHGREANAETVAQKAELEWAP
jgi:hypothetical protein